MACLTRKPRVACRPHSLAGRPLEGGDSCPPRPGRHREPRKQGQPLEAAVAVLVATPLWGSGETGSSAWAGIHMPQGAQDFSLFRDQRSPNTCRCEACSGATLQKENG